MKPDGVTMETTEPTEAAAIAEPSIPQDNITQTLASSQPEEASSDAAPKTEANANGKPAGAKPKPVTTKKQPTTKTDAASGSNSQPGTPSRRPVNDVKPSSNVASKTAPVRKQPAPSAKPSGAGAVPKKTVGFPSSNTSTSKNQTKLPDKKTAGPAKTTSTVSAAATVTNGTKPTAVNGTLKKTAGATKPKMTAPIRRPTGSTVPKPGTLTSTKPDGAAPSKTTRAATAPTPRPAAKPMTATATAKPPTNVKTTVSRVTTAPSTGRTTAAQPNKATAPLKKDVSRPPSAAVAKKTTPTSTSAAAKKPEVSKSASNTASKLSTKSDAKLPSLKPQQTIKTNATKKPAVAAARIPAVNRTASSQTPLGSPACKSPVTTNTPRSKLGHKPTWAVSPFTAIKKREKTGASNATATVASNNTAVTSGAEVTKTVAAVMQETQVETVALLQGSSIDGIAPEEQSGTSLAQSTPLEMVQQETVENRIASPPQSPARTALPQQHSVHSPTTQEDVSAPADSSFPLVAPSPQPSEEKVYLITEHTSSTSKAKPVAENSSPQIVSPSNLNEEEEEEEKEGSQLVSISEMSGTTQPTEESRPGSAGPVGASAWRVGGALLSELDSEEVSVSQQGASELSAPGVLEGTESMDDLGDGSLKGAMDMEGASAGSPDFERVPEIPVNDYDEDDEDDNDRVCDMDVGSERTDEPQRHDNDVDDDEDVEMASEGVTESGLESYGNADEDDFAEDERLDNLNRVAQPPPPPPLLPSAPAAQWDQPNPSVDSWTELNQQHLSEHEPGQGAEAAAAGPLADPWKVNSETPTQASTQAWLELGCTPCVPGNQEFTPHSSDKDQQQTLEPQMAIEEPQMAIEEPSHAPHQTLCLAPLCAPGSFLSSTVSSGMSTPEELDDNGHGEKDVLALQLSPQPELDRRDEAGTPPSEKVIGGSATAPASNPSSSSVTEDEATDTEGEAQLEDSIEAVSLSPSNVTFECQAYGQRCLSTVEEGEEIEGVDSGAAEDATPLSATSQVSYGFDSMTTASNSNAQSTGESCVKSPGIFSLEELPEEAKDPGLIQLPLAQPCPSEQQYVKCGMQDVDSAQASTDEMVRSDIAFAPSPEPQEPEQIQPLDDIQPSYYSAQASTEEMARSYIAFAPSPEPQEPEQIQPLDDIQPSYYSAICEKTENSFAGFTALLHPLRRDHSAYSRSYCDIVKPVNSALSTPKLTCADLPPRNPGQQSLSPQLRRLEQHQRHLQELQQRREQQSRPLEEAEQERKRREEEEQRRKKDEAEEEIKRNKEVEKHRLQEQEEELKKRKDLELQLHQQQEELKQRQQIMQWQQELQQSTKGQTLLLSPSSGLCTIYETLENSEDEEAGREEKAITELKSIKELNHSSQEANSGCGRVTPEDTSQTTHSPPPPPDSQQTQSSPSQLSQDGDSSPCHQESPDRPPALELDWGKKVDIVHQLINQTLLLNGDGCSSLLLLPGGAGGTLSPLESSLWPSLLPPLTPPSATVTSVSSFSPETTGSSPQGEWTVVELETHH